MTNSNSQVHSVLFSFVLFEHFHYLRNSQAFDRTFIAGLVQKRYEFCPICIDNLLEVKLALFAQNTHNSLAKYKLRRRGKRLVEDGP
jgi:hypothetical protein